MIQMHRTCVFVIKYLFSRAPVTLVVESNACVRIVFGEHGDRMMRALMDDGRSVRSGLLSQVHSATIVPRCLSARLPAIDTPALDIEY